MYRLILFFSLLVCSASSAAQVQIHFYSKDFASTFPHAFVRLTGTVEATGEPVDVNFGFTPVSVSPAILLGPVKGEIVNAEPQYIARSVRHFSLLLTDAEYRMVLDEIERWRTAAQPSYRLNSRNCVHFVAGIAALLGLQAEPVPKLMKKPKSFLRYLASINTAAIASWDKRLGFAGSGGFPVKQP